jgi:predicted anti-sigma-YlaC factor YlaD
MKTCKQSKRLQIYLDGWMEDVEAARFEKHLKKCSSCQAELIELEDVSSAALEIVDEAPESSYWESFYARTLNRIISRNVTPYERSGEPRKSLRLKIGSYSLAIVSMAALVLLTVNFLPDFLNLMAERNLERQKGLEQSESVAIVDAVETGESVELNTRDLTVSVPELVESEPVSTISQEADLASAETGENVSLDEPNASDNDILAYFRDDIPVNEPRLTLSDASDYPGESAPEEYGNINEDYRLSSSMIAAGILSEASDRYNLGRSFDNYTGFSLNEYGANSFLNGVSGNWGYLSMPPDSAEAEEFRRYLIELELIQAK